MLQFPYAPEPLVGPAPPSLPVGASAFWRPLIPCRIVAPNGIVLSYPRALLDTGSQDTLFPVDAASLGGVTLLPPTGHAVRWRGLGYPIRFGRVALRIEAQGVVVDWNAMVGFATGLPRYPILGNNGFFDHFDVGFYLSDRLVEIEPNDTFAGTVASGV